MFRLTITDNDTHVSIKSVRFTKARAVYTLAAAMIILVLFLYCIIAFTPIRTTVPGYPDEHSRKAAVENAIKIDSLESAMIRWNLYAANLRHVLTGSPAANLDSLVFGSADIAYLSDKTEAELSRSDSVLRETVINEERFGVSASSSRTLPVEGMHFFTPVKGVVSREFDMVFHPGVDITATPGAVVGAVLNGTVIFSGKNDLTGYVAIIQHDDNLISIYSNNSEILVSAGAQVHAGSPIAIVGKEPGSDGQEYLHFELWHGGQSLDPTRYISF